MSDRMLICFFGHFEATDPNIGNVKTDDGGGAKSDEEHKLRRKRKTNGS